MEEQIPMTSDRFLFLLNKGNRDESEERELQAELLRQASLQQQEITDVQSAQPAPVEVPQNMQDVPEQPDANLPVAPEEQTPEPAQEVAAEPEPEPEPAPVCSFANFVAVMVDAKQAELDYWKSKQGE